MGLQEEANLVRLQLVNPSAIMGIFFQQPGDHHSLQRRMIIWIRTSSQEHHTLTEDDAPLLTAEDEIIWM